MKSLLGILFSHLFGNAIATQQIPDIRHACPTTLYEFNQHAPEVTDLSKENSSKKTSSKEYSIISP